MTRHVSIATAIDKAKLNSSVVYTGLLEMDIIDRATGSLINTLRFAHNTEDLTFMGQLYLRANFDFQVTRAKSELPTITLSVFDQTQTIQGLLQEFRGATDFPIRILVISSANTTSPEVQESFTVLSATHSSEDYMVKFELGAENPLSARFPQRLMFRNRCFWKYKGAECGYVGSAPSCDFTADGANGCAAHANSHNFGGFRGMRRG